MTSPDYMPVLAYGSHNSPREGACIMEYVSILAGERFTDRPACTHPAFTNLAISINDRLGDAERHLLIPYIPRLIGTATDDPHVNVAIAVAMLREAERRWWRRWLPANVARDLAQAWAVLERWGRREDVSIDELAAVTVTATATAAAATAAAAAATTAAVTVTVTAIAAAAAVTAAAVTVTTAVTTATAAAVTAAAVTAAATAVNWWASGPRVLLDILGIALDAFDTASGRTARITLADSELRLLAEAMS